MSSLAEIERAAASLPKRELEQLFIFLAGQLGRGVPTNDTTPPADRHGIMDIPPARLGQMLPQPDGGDLLDEMLEGRA
jgi:hypothetical protein